MKTEKIGQVLSSKRNLLGIKITEIALAVGCNRTTIERWEKGLTRIPQTKITRAAQAYKIDPKELAELCDYPIFAIPSYPVIDDSTKVTADDLEFVLDVAKRLQKPMSLSTLLELLQCHGAK